jgi:hypothetical protein
MIKWLDKLVSIVLHLLIPEFPGIPANFFLFYDSRNSGITTYIGLFTNDQSWLSIEFRCGIPGIVRAWNRSGIGRNSRNSGITTYIGLFTNDQSWLSIEFRYGIPGIGRNSHRFPEFRNHNLHWLVYE